MQARFNAGMPRPDDLSTLAGRLAYARTRRKLTQVELAEKAGMQQPAVSKLLRGKMQKTTAIARLAAALEVPAEWLEHGKGDEPRWDPNAPNPPPSDFSDRDRKPSPSEWALLDALKWLPDNEVEDLRAEVLAKAARYEEFVQKQTAKIGRRELAPARGRDNLGGYRTGFGDLPDSDEESSDG